MKKAIIVGLGATAVFLLIAVLFKLLSLTLELFGLIAGVLFAAIVFGLFVSVIVYATDRWIKPND